ncbi:MAG: hypothetical protein JNL32_03875 [Candidatus Kapabacteria bacterium]|nr:hypothetical protein [Candidatus Kapabacteria bacterium]
MQRELLGFGYDAVIMRADAVGGKVAHQCLDNGPTLGEEADLASLIFNSEH